MRLRHWLIRHLAQHDMILLNAVIVIPPHFKLGTYWHNAEVLSRGNLLTYDLDYEFFFDQTVMSYSTDDSETTPVNFMDWALLEDWT